jgi:hypothetical protein
VPTVVVSFALGVGVDRLLFERGTLPDSPEVRVSRPGPSKRNASEGTTGASEGAVDGESDPRARGSLAKPVLKPTDAPAAPEERKPGTKTALQKKEDARRIFEAYVQAAGNTADPEDLNEIMRLVSELDAESAPYFIEQYHAHANKPSSSDEREIALEFALACGGPETTKLVKRLLSDERTPVEDRATLLTDLSGLSSSGISIKRLPVDQELSELAFSLLRSPKSEERSCAIGILGGVNSPEARSAACQVITNDPDPRAQAAAIRALGHIGDASAVDLLTSFALTKARTAGKSAGVLDAALESAMRELQKRFPK